VDFARQAVEAEESAETLAALARAQARLGDPAARETAERAVAADAGSITAQLARGEALLSAHLAQEAADAFEKLPESGPHVAETRTGLAHAFVLQGRGEEALAAAWAATEADARSGEAQAALGLAALRRDPEDTSNEAVSAVQQGSLLEPRNAAVKLAVGRVFESRGQIDLATLTYQEAAALDPTWAPPRVAQLSVQFRKGDVAGALAGLYALPDALKSAPEAQLLLGLLLLQEKDANGARVALEAAVAGLPGRAEAQGALGRDAYDSGDLALAADSYGRAVKLEPDNLGYRSNHGLLLGYDGRLDEGLAVLLELTGSPGYAEPGGFINLGWVYRNLKPPKVAEAVAAYERALKLDPKSGQAALGIALAYRAGKQWPKAITAYQRVSQVDRRLDAEALLGTAWCHYRAGDGYKAAFFAGLAAKGGADIRALRKALTKMNTAAAAPKKAPPAPKPEDDLAELVDQLESRDAGSQVRAVRSLVGLGRPAVPYLAAALREPSTSIGAREAIVDGLRKLGPAARDALPHLDHLVREGPPVPAVDATREQMAHQIREARLVSAMQAAAEAIRGK
jgi:superkiller protein 3